MRRIAWPNLRNTSTINLTQHVTITSVRKVFDHIGKAYITHQTSCIGHMKHESTSMPSGKRGKMISVSSTWRYEIQVLYAISHTVWWPRRCVASDFISFFTEELLFLCSYTKSCSIDRDELESCEESDRWIRPRSKSVLDLYRVRIWDCAAEQKPVTSRAACVVSPTR